MKRVMTVAVVMVANELLVHEEDLVAAGNWVLAATPMVAEWANGFDSGPSCLVWVPAYCQP